jgi:acyl-coenzyme A thioesterase PaaI-like protein
MTDPDSRVNRSYFRRRWEANQLPASGVWATRRRLADAMRTVIERLTISDAPEEELRVAAARLEEYAAHLERHPRRQKYVGFAETAVADAGGAEADAATGGHFDLSPLIGLSNPLSPPITMSSDEATGRVRGEVVFGSAYEGPPGCVHGGYVAAAFDEVLGYSETFSGNPGMTGTLTVVYRSPTPLHRKVVFEAWIERTERRKVFCHGTLHAGEELCAEADGIFISMKPGVYARLVAQREKQEGA